MKAYAIKFGIFSLLVSLSSYAATDVVNIPEEELAKEYVLPKFDSMDSVKNRNVVTDHKMEFGAYYGFNITEPIYNQGKMGVNLGYHLSETSAITLNYAQWNSGKNTLYTDDLESTAISADPLDFSRIPKRRYSLFAHYEWKVFYGKISFTKQGVMNLSTYPIFGLGYTAYEHKNYPGVDLGIGQKFYFGKSVSLRVDLKLQYSQYPSPFLQGKMVSSVPRPAPGDFKDKTGTSTILDLGLSFLF